MSKFSSFSEVSKAVGWDRRSVSYPTSIQVTQAIETEDWVRLLTWYRFLPSPQLHGDQGRIMDIIVDGVRDIMTKKLA